MVDEYNDNRVINITVQEFRFLYGRWILDDLDPGVQLRIGSDSSMVDEYLSHGQALCF